MLATSLKHPTLNTLLYGISLDSDKHSIPYAALLKLLEGEVALSEVELKNVAEVIDNHIKVEESMIERTRELLNSIEDSRFKLILDAIYANEVSHHRLLLSIKKAIAEYAMITERDFWNMIWKDSPYHEAPAD